MTTGAARRSEPIGSLDSLISTEVETDSRVPFDDAVVGNLRAPRRARSHAPEHGAGERSRRRGWFLRRLLAGADLCAIAAAVLVTEWTATRISGTPFTTQLTEVGVFLATLPAWIVAAKLYGLYDQDDERADHSATDEFASVFHMITVCTTGVAALCYLTGLAHPRVDKLLVFWAASIISICCGRGIARACARRSSWYLQNTLIVGAGDVGQRIARKLLQHPEYGIRLVGLVDAEPKERRADLEHLTIVGAAHELPELVCRHDVERVIVAFSNSADTEMLELMRRLKDLDVQVDVVPRLYELVYPGVDLHTVEGVPLISLPQMGLSRSSLAVKRGFDILVASVALVIAAPFFLLVAAVIMLDSRGPAFFRQTRMGAGERMFSIIKFRTMVADADARKHEVAHLNHHSAIDTRMFKAADDPRVTRVGAFLRRTSIDELPQLINVLRGDMSLVGPRPLILEEHGYVVDWARDRLRLKPGITGLWQVLGRSDIPFGEMIQLDYLYVTSWSLGGDFKLIAKTFPHLFSSRGATR